MMFWCTIFYSWCHFVSINQIVQFLLSSDIVQCAFGLQLPAGVTSFNSINKSSNRINSLMDRYSVPWSHTAVDNVVLVIFSSKWLDSWYNITWPVIDISDYSLLQVVFNLSTNNTSTYVSILVVLSWQYMIHWFTIQLSSLIPDGSFINCMFMNHLGAITELYTLVDNIRYFRVNAL